MVDDQESAERRTVSVQEPQQEVVRALATGREYQSGLNKIRKDHEEVGGDRFKELVASAAVALRHFFDKDTYGDPNLCTPDKKPAYWSYVRFLTWDALRPRFDQGETEYANHNYKDEFVQDLADEANEIAAMLPEDLAYPEWTIMVRVWSHMMTTDPYLVDEGFVTNVGRQNLVSHSMAMGPSSRIYHENFRMWREQYSTGLRDIVEGKKVGSSGT